MKEETTLDTREELYGDDGKMAKKEWMNESKAHRDIKKTTAASEKTRMRKE